MSEKSKEAIRIELLYNKGFRWEQVNNVYYKGCFSNDLKESMASIAQQLTIYSSIEEIGYKLRGIHGNFVFVIDKGDSVILCTDNIRSIPIFFSSDGMIISDSAEHIRKMMNINIEDVDLSLFGELLLKRNTQPGKTVYGQILQVEPCEVIKINKKSDIEHFFYYSHSHKEYKSEHRQLEELFVEALKKSVDNTCEDLSERQIVIPLSGGYDSRLLACLLKEKGYNNVVCYTYGRSKDYEVIYSEKVADSLGYEWHYIEYNVDKWKAFFRDPKALVYFDFASNHCAFPHLQEYIAINELVNNQIIREGAVVIPGFCGDAHAGSFVPQKFNYSFDLQGVVDYAYEAQYTNFECLPEQKAILKKQLYSYLHNKHINVFDKDSFISAYDEWTINARLSMYIVNSLRVYEYFNLEWRLPMLDYGFVDFWYSISNKYRIQENFYIDTIFRQYFKKYNVEFKKPQFRTVHTSRIKSLVTSFIKSVLVKVSLITGKDFYKRNNWNAFNQASLQMYNNCSFKNLKYFKSIDISSIEAFWWCSKVYGANNVIKILGN